MGIRQTSVAGRGRRGRATVVAAAALTAATALTAGTLAGTGPAAALARGSTAGVISTVVGGVGGPGLATQVGVALPCGVSFAGGSVYIGDVGYIADGGAVRKVSARTDWLTTPVGIATNGPIGNGGPATAATVNTACGTAMDHSGNLVIADGGNNRVRVVAARTGTFYGIAMTANDIYTVAGTGQRGYSGDGGPATSAELDGTRGVAVDGAGNLVIADAGDHRIRVIAAHTGTYYGIAMTAEDIYTIAGTGTGGYSGDGGPATSAELHSPQGVAMDGAGNLVIADGANNRIRVVAAHTGTYYGIAMTGGDIYTIAGGGTGGLGDGGPATSAKLKYPTGVTVDGSGNVLIAVAYQYRVRVVAARTGTYYGIAMTAGDIYTIAGDGGYGYSGDGGPATSAELAFPQGVAVDGSGNVVIADTNNQRVRVVAARTGTYYGIAMTAGDIYTIAGDGNFGYSGNGGPATAAELYGPAGVAVDGAGNLVDADGPWVRVTAARTGTFYGITMTAGDIYTVAGGGTALGDGGPAVGAELNGPQGVAVDGSGNLVIADTHDHRIRVVAVRTGTFYGIAMTAGDIYTVAGNGKGGHSGDGGPAASAELSSPGGVAVDNSGNLVIADTENNRVRVVAATTGTFYGIAMTAGDIYTIAGGGTGGLGDGGPATSARIHLPQSVATDSAGNLVIADPGNDRVRVVAARTGTYYGIAMTAGDIYTVAGTGKYGFSGDGGPATSAEFNGPEGVAVDSAGNLLIADYDNNRVRVVAAHTGTYYGIAVTAGDIYTVAGIRGYGFSGDGGPAIRAQLSEPEGVAVDGAGNLLIADLGNSRIRLVTG